MPRRCSVCLDATVRLHVLGRVAAQPLIVELDSGVRRTAAIASVSTRQPASGKCPCRGGGRVLTSGTGQPKHRHGNEPLPPKGLAMTRVPIRGQTSTPNEGRQRRRHGRIIAGKRRSRKHSSDPCGHLESYGPGISRVTALPESFAYLAGRSQRRVTCKTASRRSGDVRRLCR